MLFAPLRIFLTSGLILLVIGIAYGLGAALSLGRGVPVAALFAGTAGGLLIMLGLIADQLSQLRLAMLTASADRSRENEREPGHRG